MKKYLSFLLLVLHFSCMNSYYHVATLQSEQVKLIGNDLVFENEHLKVAYNFWEQGGRMRFLLFNKTDQPLYLDWSKSFLVRNDAKTAYNQFPPLPRGAADTVRYSYQNMVVAPYRVTARANSLTEIPPQTFVAIADFPVQQVIVHKRTKEKEFTYTNENSPLRIGQHLTYSFDKTLTNVQTINHSFWVDKIRVVRTRELTRLYGSLAKGQPNALYAVEKRGATVRIVVITAAVTTATYFIVLDAIFSNFSVGF